MQSFHIWHLSQHCLWLLIVIQKDVQSTWKENNVCACCETTSAQSFTKGSQYKRLSLSVFLQGTRNYTSRISLQLITKHPQGLSSINAQSSETWRTSQHGLNSAIWLQATQQSCNTHFSSELWKQMKKKFSSKMLVEINSLLHIEQINKAERSPDGKEEII